MKKIFLLILGILLLTGCSNKVTYGEVITKEHNKAYRQLVMIPVHTYNGKISTTIMIPYWIFHEENWKIEIKGKNKEGNIDTDIYYITENLYDEINIGDMYEYRPDLDLTEEPVVKIKKDKASEEQLNKYDEIGNSNGKK